MEREIKLAPDGTTIGHGNPLNDERARLAAKADEEKESSGEFVEVSEEGQVQRADEAQYQSNEDDVAGVVEAMARARGQFHVVRGR
jgi:hypothetical protein